MGSRSRRASKRRRRPQTVAAFRRLLPLESRIIHVRWSGEAGWIPFGDLDLGLGPENATCYPIPGEIVLYPGGVSETEILLAYGYVNFASKAGQLAGNHFATVVEGNENLRPLGVKFLWEGAQEIVFREAVEARSRKWALAARELRDPRSGSPSGPCPWKGSASRTACARAARAHCGATQSTKSIVTGAGKAPIASPRRNSSATAVRPSSP